MCALACIRASAAFTVSQRRILRDGSPFFVQGVCYQPTPIGNNNTRYEPYGDYFTANYSALYQRDLPRVRAMGGNVLRVYGWKSNQSHTDFLDRCYNSGISPVFVLLNSWINPGTDWSNTAAVAALAQQFVALDGNVANHPAVLGIVIGNEVNSQNGNATNPAFWAAMNTIAQAVKTSNPSRMVSIAITDATAQVREYNASLPKLDFWCVQVYRQPTFGSFFTEYAAASTKPLIVTEFGLDAYDHANSREYLDSAGFVGDRLAALWGDVFNAGLGSEAVSSGACVFEYSDEWYKFSGAGSGDLQHDAGGWAASWFPDGYADEEWWGLFSVARTNGGAAPDTLTPRAGVAKLTALWTAPLRAVTQPQALMVRVGSSAQLRFETVSPLATTYEWRRGGTLLTGGANGVLGFAPVVLGDAGVYQARAVTSGGALASDAVQVVVHDEDYLSYSSWAAATFTSGQLGNPAIAGPAADPDGAGVANLLRYAFKTAARSGSLATPPVAIAAAPGQGGSYAEVRFTRKTYDPKLTYVVETSTDLATWTVMQTLVPGAPSAQVVRWGTPLGAEPRRFFRVRVELAP
jgi:hypothetical protein